MVTGIGIHGHIRIEISDGRQYTFENTITNAGLSALRDALRTGSTTRIANMTMEGSQSGGSWQYTTTAGVFNTSYTAEFHITDISPVAGSGQTMVVTDVKLKTSGGTVYAEHNLGSGQITLGYMDQITVYYTISFSGNQAGQSSQLRLDIQSMCRQALVAGSCGYFSEQRLVNQYQSAEQTLSGTVGTAATYSVGSDNYYAIKVVTNGIDPDWEPYYARVYNNSGTLMDQQSIAPYIGEKLINLTHWIYIYPAIA